jgi:pimeloyl-ACP methyl ester carboxylesterase
MNFDLVVEDLNHITEHLGLTKFTVMGNCFGSRVAMEYAARYP